MIKEKGNIFYERWDTPVKTSDQLYFWSVFKDSHSFHFYFERRFEEIKEFYELTVDSGCAYRITEEGMGRWCIVDLFDNNGPDDSIENSKYKTYKFWNTAFAKDMYEGYALSEKNMEPEKTFHYLIVSEDEYIEFFTLTAPKWILLEKGMTIPNRIADYLKEWGPDED